METEMVVIRDLVSLEAFFKHAVRSTGGIDLFRPLSIGEEGLNELQSIFEKEVLPNNMICTFQVAETPITDNGSGLSKACFNCTIMIMKKMGGAAITHEKRLVARNETWKKMLRLIGLIRLAAEWYSVNTTEVEGEAYEVMFQIYQDKLLPLGKVANANIQGWYLDIDVSIPVDGLMYV